MEDRFPTYRWRYVSKKPKARFIIYARTRETADKIIEIENTDNIFVLKPARFRFKTPCAITIPPYGLEMDELDAAEAKLKKRREYFELHPEKRFLIAKTKK